MKKIQKMFVIGDYINSFVRLQDCMHNGEPTKIVKYSAPINDATFFTCYNDAKEKLLDIQNNKEIIFMSNSLFYFTIDNIPIFDKKSYIKNLHIYEVNIKQINSDIHGDSEDDLCMKYLSDMDDMYK